MRYFIPAAVVPAVLTLLILYLFRHSLASEIVDFRGLDWLSVLGLLLTYLGFLFSLFAAVKVREISGAYFTKARLPSLLAQIKDVVDYMSKSSNSNSNKIDIDARLSKIPAILASIERTKGHNVSGAIKEVRSTYSTLREWMDGSRQSGSPIGDSTAYWRLISKMSEIAELIEAFIEEEKAR